MFLQASVILLTGGVPDQAHTSWDQVHPPGLGTPRDQVHLPGTRFTPWDRIHPPGPGTPPRNRYTPPDQVQPPRPGTRPLQDQVHPPGAEHAGRYGQHAGGTHPTGMQSCLYMFCRRSSNGLRRVRSTATGIYSEP